MPTITRKLEFDYGHRVLGHEGRCKHLHGHRGVVEITVTAPELDSLGRVIDFGVIKKLVGGWIDENWDHNFICHPDDPLLQGPKIFMYEELMAGKPPYIMPSGVNPTAENLAKELFIQAANLLSWDKDSGLEFHNGIKVVRVRFWETPNSYADYPDQLR